MRVSMELFLGSELDKDFDEVFKSEVCSEYDKWSKDVDAELNKLPEQEPEDGHF